MKYLGIVMLVLAVFIGLYVGLWLLFIGGILDVVEALFMGEIELNLLGIGVLKMLSGKIVGFLMWISISFLGMGFVLK